jgi:4-amino-4-deoxy-L-arabinose transferase-like glycosyltransferase
VVLLVLAGLGMRIWLLRSPLGVYDADESISALVVRHLLHGEWTTFQWGVAYGGILEQLIAVPFFAVWRDPVVLKLVMVGLNAGACVLTWRIGRRLVGEAPARFAALLVWVASPAYVFRSVKTLYYGTALCLTQAILLCCVHIAETRSRKWTVLLGLLLGLGLWTSPMVAYVAVPAVAWLLLTRRDRWRDLVVAIPGAVIGAAPWLIFTVRHPGSAFHQESSMGTNPLDRLEGFFRDLLPRGLGIKVAHNGEWFLGPAVSKTLYLALLGAFAFLVVQTVWRRRSALTPLLVVAGAYPFLFAYPHASFYVSEPRYGVFLWPVVALLLAYGATRLLRVSWMQAGTLALIALWTTLTLVGALHWAQDHPGHWDFLPPDTSELARVLEQRGDRTVWTEYWMSYSLVLASREHVIADPVEGSRYPPYRRQVQAAGTTTHAYFLGSAWGERLLADAHAANIAVRQIPVGSFVIYELERPLPPQGIEGVRP